MATTIKKLKVDSVISADLLEEKEEEEEEEEEEEIEDNVSNYSQSSVKESVVEQISVKSSQF